LTQTVLPTSNIDSSQKTPSGPRGHFLLGNLHEMKYNSLNFYLKIAHEYGDVARIRLLSKPLYCVSHPDGIRRIFQKNHLNYDRRVLTIKPVRLFLGNGLTLSDGAFWQRQRHLMQPAFHRRYIAGMATQVIKAGDAFLKHWENRANRDAPLDIHKEMLHLTLSIVGMTLFGLDLSAENPMGQAFRMLTPALVDYIFLPFPPLSVPTPRNRRIQATLNTLNTLVYDLIRKRREQKTVTFDLLSLLLATDEDGSGMNDQQLRDEILTLFFAGHESTATTLTWAWYALSQHPEMEHRLWEEIDAVLHGEHPTVADLPQLPYARMIIDETLRLYPPATLIPRRALADDTICGYRIPANCEVMANIYATHRHPAYWEQPEIFNPDRFLPDHPCEGARAAYFPFGGGPHLCIGNNFALIEAQILITMIAQRYQLQLVPGQTAEPVQRLSIDPRHGLPMFLKERK
jgi:cytochrome P450